MTQQFTYKYLISPFKKKWGKGLFLLLLWTVAFIVLPAVSGWFLAMCSLVFITANYAFSYLVPSAIIRLTAIFRTVTRYFERLENHKTTLDVQQSLQLKIFRSVAKLPYFKKQGNNNSKLLDNSTHGVDAILNHILLWLLPLSSLILALVIYAVFVAFFSSIIALEFLISAAVLLFLVPQFFFRKNYILFNQLKAQREENNHDLIQSFRGRIEISKYKLEEKAISQHEHRLTEIDKTEKKLQINSFYLQMAAGLGFSFLATFIIWQSSHFGINAQTAIGIFFGIMAQAELAEILFSGKSERAAVRQHMTDIQEVLEHKTETADFQKPESSLSSLQIVNLSAKIPETNIETASVNLDIKQGDWIALYGETGKGKTTFLNSLFYPEYKKSGTITWNKETEIPHLSAPECIYVTQKAYLLTGTLRENFQSYDDAAIEEVLADVDLSDWRQNLPLGLNTWIGENGETLSGGQRKKLLLAQALLKKPQLLVVDEPTAGISSENAIEIFRHIRRKYPKMTILMATHLTDFEKHVSEVIRL